MKGMILHLRHHLAREPFIEDIVQHIKSFNTVTLCSDRVPETYAPTVYRYHLLNQAPVPWRWGWIESGGWIALTGNLPYHDSLDYDRVRLIHAHFGPTGVWALPLRKRLHVPLVTSFYGYDVTQHPRHVIWRMFYRVLFDQGDRFLVLGPVMKQRLITLGCEPEKVLIHRLGIDPSQIPFTERYPPTAPRPLRVLMVGRLVEKKGFDCGIAAFAKVAECLPQARLRIVGEGPERRKLTRLIEEEGLQSCVTLLGRVSRERVFEEMSHAHVLLAPSVTASNGDQEGTPTVLLEAQASGLPVIATRHSDIPSTLLEGQSGYLVPERDVDALAERLIEVLTHPESWSAMSRAGRHHIEVHCDIRQLSRSLETMYHSLQKPSGP